MLEENHLLLDMWPA